MNRPASHRAIVIAALTLSSAVTATAQTGTPTLVADIVPGAGDSTPNAVTALGGSVYFFAGSTGNRGLYRTDGTPAGTVLIKGGFRATPAMAAFGDKLLLSVDDGASGTELWISDGTRPGTRLVKDIDPGAGGSNPGGFHLLNDVPGVGGLTAVFVAADPAAGREMFRTDGTPAGTVRLGDHLPATSGPGKLTRAGGLVYFTARDGNGTSRLWRTDGTAGGTFMPRTDMWVGEGLETNLVPFGSKVCLPASDSAHGNEIFVSDGTAAGTTVLADITPGSGNSNPTHLALAAGTLFFNSPTQSNGEELWTIDLFTGAFALVKDIRPGGVSSRPRNLVGTFDQLFFTADDGTNGRELWVSDGTQGSTVMPLDIWAGSHASVRLTHAPLLEPVGARRVFFAAEDGTHGSELWESDGSKDGTRLVADLANAGLHKDANPLVVAVARGLVWFTADHPTYGNELWVVCPDAVRHPAGEGCGANGLVPELDSDDPRLGRAWTVLFRALLPGTAGVWLIAPPLATPIRVFPGCWVPIDLGRAVAVPMLHASAATRATINIPANPALHGVVLYMQSAVADQRSPNGLALTNGVAVKIGN